MPWRAAAWSASMLFNVSAPIQSLDPLCQVVAAFPGARQDSQVRAVAVVVGGDDDCPGRRRAIARRDAAPGELGGQARAPSAAGTDHQLQPVRDGQLRGNLLQALKDVLAQSGESLPGHDKSEEEGAEDELQA